ncbi:MAG TPA: asparaginase [Gaiellaceae bacterium]|jgi:L-asparaginase II
MEPLVVEATRGTVVEARHRVHAVAVSDGRVVAAAGEPGLVTYLRSSAKPIQALPLVRARPELGDTEIAIACASHLAEPQQLAAVWRLLASAPAEESELECGPAAAPIRHNCSGKHAGFLALCRARGWPSAGYSLPGHPSQQEVLSEVADAAGVDPASMPTAPDGCGVPTFALPLERMAAAFARLPARDGAPRALAAVRAHPELVRGPLAADSQLMRQLPGWTAKGGAEGLLCACSPDGVGIAVKVEDGAFRALGPAVGELLRRLGHDPGELAVAAVENSRGEPVGTLRVTS